MRKSSSLGKSQAQPARLSDERAGTSKPMQSSLKGSRPIKPSIPEHLNITAFFAQFRAQDPQLTCQLSMEGVDDFISELELPQSVLQSLLATRTDSVTFHELVIACIRENEDAPAIQLPLNDVYLKFAKACGDSDGVTRKDFDLLLQFFGISTSFDLVKKNIIFVDRVADFREFLDFLSIAPKAKTETVSVPLNSISQQFISNQDANHNVAVGRVRALARLHNISPEKVEAIVKGRATISFSHFMQLFVADENYLETKLRIPSSLMNRILVDFYSMEVSTMGCVTFAELQKGPLKDYGSLAKLRKFVQEVVGQDVVFFSDYILLQAKLIEQGRLSVSEMDDTRAEAKPLTTLFAEIPEDDILMMLQNYFDINASPNDRSITGIQLHDVIFQLARLFDISIDDTDDSFRALDYKKDASIYYNQVALLLTGVDLTQHVFLMDPVPIPEDKHPIGIDIQIDEYEYDQIQHLNQLLASDDDGSESHRSSVATGDLLDTSRPVDGRPAFGLESARPYSGKFEEGIRKVSDPNVDPKGLLASLSLDALRLLFVTFDDDGDETLTRSQFCELSSILHVPYEVADMIRANKLVDFNQVVTMAMNVTNQPEGISFRDVKVLFEMIDKPRRGFLNIHQLAQLHAEIRDIMIERDDIEKTLGELDSRDEISFDRCCASLGFNWFKRPTLALLRIAFNGIDNGSNFVSFENIIEICGEFGALPLKPTIQAKLVGKDDISFSEFISVFLTIKEFSTVSLDEVKFYFELSEDYSGKISLEEVHQIIATQLDFNMTRDQLISSLRLVHSPEFIDFNEFCDVLGTRIASNDSARLPLDGPVSARTGGLWNEVENASKHISQRRTLDFFASLNDDDVSQVTMERGVTKRSPRTLIEDYEVDQTPTHFTGDKTLRRTAPNVERSPDDPHVLRVTFFSRTGITVDGKVFKGHVVRITVVIEGKIVKKAVIRNFAKLPLAGSGSVSLRLPADVPVIVPCDVNVTIASDDGRSYDEIFKRVPSADVSKERSTILPQVTTQPHGSRRPSLQPSRLSITRTVNNGSTHQFPPSLSSGAVSRAKIGSLQQSYVTTSRFIRSEPKQQQEHQRADMSRFMMNLPIVPELSFVVHTPREMKQTKACLYLLTPRLFQRLSSSEVELELQRQLILFRPCSPESSMYCLIKRETSVNNTVCHLFVEGSTVTSARYLMTARRKPTSRSLQFMVTTSPLVKTKHHNSYMGKVAANSTASAFSIFDFGLDKYIDKDTARHEVGAVMFRRFFSNEDSKRRHLVPGSDEGVGAVLADKTMSGVLVILPKLSDDDQPTRFRPQFVGDTVICRFAQEDDSLMQLRAKPPTWDPDRGGFYQDWGHRSPRPSIKNTVLCMDGFPDEKVLQFGRLNDNCFCLDFTYPFSPYQAFSVALCLMQKTRQSAT